MLLYWWKWNPYETSIFFRPSFFLPSFLPSFLYLHDPLQCISSIPSIVVLHTCWIPSAWPFVFPTPYITPFMSLLYDPLHDPLWPLPRPLAWPLAWPLSWPLAWPLCITQCMTLYLHDPVAQEALHGLLGCLQPRPRLPSEQGPSILV